MTLSERITAELSAVYPDGLTNTDLATRLSANVPSIRRSIQGLRQTRTIEFFRYADASATDMLWRVSK